MQLIHTPTSSNITAFGWEDGDLYIQFKKSGTVYSYSDVPRQTHLDMIAADSVGSFFHAHVKKSFAAAMLLKGAENLGFEREEVAEIHA